MDKARIRFQPQSEGIKEKQIIDQGSLFHTPIRLVNLAGQREIFLTIIIR